MDALRVFYQIRHDQGLFDALLSDLRFVFASGSRFQAMAAVQAQCAYVMRHRQHRPAGRDETGGMLGSVTTKAEALELCSAHKPDILITYDNLEDSDGLALVEEARKQWPELRILLIIQLTTLPRLRQALEAGANGVLTDALIADGYILTALQRLMRGDAFLDPGLGVLMETSEAGYDPRLSLKQISIMTLVLAGLSDREISKRLGIAFDTVRYQLKQIYRELGTNNRCHACLILLQLGLLRMPDLPELRRKDRRELINLLQTTKAKSKNHELR